jgi:deoxyribodipyrimidine photo-lyase
MDSLFEAPALASVVQRFPFLPDRVASPIRGGRKAALAALRRIDPVRYARSRNFLDGANTGLSPYLRHGVLTLAEVRDAALARVAQPLEAEKLISELGWRDYWQRLYVQWGEGIWRDREPIKTGFAAASYASELPPELLAATTGLNCMDSFSRQLQQTGWLHNHARMWVNAYVVHWLRVRWQAGARWFLEHLLDGDPASNNLSWQWGASTFSNKPYFFNRENLERFTNGSLCAQCALRTRCPLEGTYEALETRLFPKLHQIQPAAAPVPVRAQPIVAAKPNVGSKPLLWIHTDSLNPEAALLRQHPLAPAVFVWDEAWLRAEKISSKRVVFLEECLDEMPARLERRNGDVATELLQAARQAGAGHIVAQRTPDPRLLAAAASAGRELPIVWIDPPPFAADLNYDLKRFSRYWQKAQASAMRKTEEGR